MLYAKVADLPGSYSDPVASPGQSAGYFIFDVKAADLTG